MIENLDVKWIEDFEKEDKNYKEFYKEPLEKLDVDFIYINEENEIEKLIQEKYNLKTKNLFSKEELIYAIKTHISPNKQLEDKISLKKADYKLFSILLYNIDINNDKIKNIQETSFLQSIRHLNDIILNDSIKCLHNLNSLYILFYENTKRISHNKTKRIHLKSAHKKTKRQMF